MNVLNLLALTDDLLSAELQRREARMQQAGAAGDDYAVQVWMQLCTAVRAEQHRRRESLRPTSAALMAHEKALRAEHRFVEADAVLLQLLECEAAQ